MFFLSFCLFKAALNTTRYCGPKEFVSCAGDVESKEGIKPEIIFCQIVFILFAKTINEI